MSMNIVYRSRLYFSLVTLNKPVIKRNVSDVKSLMRNTESQRNKAFQTKKYFMLIIPITSFVLGVWQVRRREWKLSLIKDLNYRISQPVKPLPTDFIEFNDMEYMKVEVEGTFDHQRETLILPRANIHSLDKNLPVQNGGAYVVTPFKLTDGREILVNRGWVPRKKLDPQTRSHAQLTDKVKLVGVLRHNEIRPAYSASTSQKHWHTRDIDGLSQQLGTLPIFIDADIKSTVEGGPIGGQTKVQVRNDHTQYLLTWFALSAATTFMWVKMFVLK